MEWNAGDMRVAEDMTESAGHSYLETAAST